MSGLTAGASAPEVLVEQVSERLAEYGFTDQSDRELIREDVRFTLPSELAVIATSSQRGVATSSLKRLRGSAAPQR